jgi:hypothetical protein
MANPPTMLIPMSSTKKRMRLKLFSVTVGMRDERMTLKIYGLITSVSI